MISHPVAVSVPPRNALLPASPPPSRHASRAPVDLHGLLASTIGHAALLSDTPSKWASTLAMLRQNGVDPQGFEDFDKGRPAAIAAAGTEAPQDDTD